MNTYTILPVEELIQPLPISPHLYRSNKQDVKLQSFRDRGNKKKPGSPNSLLPSIKPSPHRTEDVMLSRSPSEKHGPKLKAVKRMSIGGDRKTAFMRRRRKLYLSMDEVLATSLKKKSNNAAIRTLTQEEEQDPKKILLYDEQAYNRKRAARRLCEMITQEVRGINAPTDVDKGEKSVESSESITEKEETQLEFPDMKVDDFKQYFPDDMNLSEKLDIVKRLSHEYMETQRLKAIKTVSFRDMQVEFEQTNPAAAESALMATSKSVDKFRHAGGEWAELVESEQVTSPMRLSRIQFISKELFSKVPGLRLLLKLVENMRITEFKSLLDAKKLTEAGEDGSSKELFSFRKLILVDFSLKPGFAVNIFTYMSKPNELRIVDFGNNPLIGDVAGPTIIYLLSHYSPLLFKLSLHNTGLGLNSAYALKDMLNSHHLKLRTLLIGRNNLGEAGLCHISMSLIFNKYIQIADLSYNGGETAAALAFAKMMRMNRFCKVLNISGNALPLELFREICRSLIVNCTLVHFSLIDTGLTDAAMKELAHSLNSNKALQVLMLNSNEVTGKGLQLIRAALPSHPALAHIGLSGNAYISLVELEEVKTALVKKIDIEIIKEEDFGKTPDTQSLALDKLLKQ